MSFDTNMELTNFNLSFKIEDDTQIAEMQKRKTILENVKNLKKKVIDIDLLINQRNKIQDQYDSIKNDLCMVRSENESLQKDLQAAKNKNNLMDAKLKLEKSKLETTIKELNEKNEKHDLKINEQQQHIKQLTFRNRELEKENSTLKDENKKLELVNKIPKKPLKKPSKTYGTQTEFENIDNGKEILKLKEMTEKQNMKLYELQELIDKLELENKEVLRENCSLKENQKILEEQAIKSPKTFSNGKKISCQTKQQSDSSNNVPHFKKNKSTNTEVQKELLPLYCTKCATEIVSPAQQVLGAMTYYYDNPGNLSPRNSRRFSKVDHRNISAIHSTQMEDDNKDFAIPAMHKNSYYNDNLPDENSQIAVLSKKVEKIEKILENIDKNENSNRSCCSSKNIKFMVQLPREKQVLKCVKRNKTKLKKQNLKCLKNIKMKKISCLINDNWTVENCLEIKKNKIVSNKKKKLNSQRTKLFDSAPSTGSYVRNPVYTEEASSLKSHDMHKVSSENKFDMDASEVNSNPVEDNTVLSVKRIKNNSLISKTTACKNVNIIDATKKSGIKSTRINNKLGLMRNTEDLNINLNKPNIDSEIKLEENAKSKLNLNKSDDETSVNINDTKDKLSLELSNSETSQVPDSQISKNVQSIQQKEVDVDLENKKSALQELDNTLSSSSSNVKDKELINLPPQIDKIPRINETIYSKTEVDQNTSENNSVDANLKQVQIMKADLQIEEKMSVNMEVSNNESINASKTDCVTESINNQNVNNFAKIIEDCQIEIAEKNSNVNELSTSADNGKTLNDKDSNIIMHDTVLDEKIKEECKAEKIIEIESPASPDFDDRTDIYSSSYIDENSLHKINYQNTSIDKSIESKIPDIYNFTDENVKSNVNENSLLENDDSQKNNNSERQIIQNEIEPSKKGIESNLPGFPNYKNSNDLGSKIIENSERVNEIQTGKDVMKKEDIPIEPEIKKENENDLDYSPMSPDFEVSPKYNSLLNKNENFEKNQNLKIESPIDVKIIDTEIKSEEIEENNSTNLSIKEETKNIDANMINNTSHKLPVSTPITRRSRRFLPNKSQSLMPSSTAKIVNSESTNTEVNPSKRKRNNSVVSYKEFSDEEVEKNVKITRQKRNSGSKNIPIEASSQDEIIIEMPIKNRKKLVIIESSEEEEKEEEEENRSIKRKYDFRSKNSAKVTTEKIKIELPETSETQKLDTSDIIECLEEEEPIQAKPAVKRKRTSCPKNVSKKLPRADSPEILSDDDDIKMKIETPTIPRTRKTRANNNIRQSIISSMRKMKKNNVKRYSAPTFKSSTLDMESIDLTIDSSIDSKSIENSNVEISEKSSTINNNTSSNVSKKKRTATKPKSAVLKSENDSPLQAKKETKNTKSSTNNIESDKISAILEDYDKTCKERAEFSRVMKNKINTIYNNEKISFKALMNSNTSSTQSQSDKPKKLRSLLQPLDFGDLNFGPSMSHQINLTGNAVRGSSITSNNFANSDKTTIMKGESASASNTITTMKTTNNLNEINPCNSDNFKSEISTQSNVNLNKSDSSTIHNANKSVPQIQHEQTSRHDTGSIPEENESSDGEIFDDDEEEESPTKKLRSREVVVADAESPRINKKCRFKRFIPFAINEENTCLKMSPIVCRLNQYMSRPHRESNNFQKNKLSQDFKRNESYIQNQLNQLIDTEEWTSEINLQVANTLFESQNLKMIAVVLIEFAASITSEEIPLDKSNTPPAPLMTRPEQKLVTLIHTICKENPDFYGMIMDGIQYKLFRLGQPNSVLVVESLFRIAVVLGKIQKDREKIRMFICDALYCLGFRAINIIYVALVSWPEIIPQYDPDTSNDILIDTIMYTIFNLTVTNNPYPKLNALRKLLSTTKNYPNSGYKPEDFKQKILLGLNNLVPNISDAVLILCKKQGHDWARKNIAGTIITIVVNHHEAHPNPYELLKLLGNVLRSFGPNETDFIVNIIDGLCEVLNSNSSSENLQEGIVTCLLSIIKYKFLPVAESVLKWQFKKDLRPTTITKLDTFFKSHDSKWWSKFIKDNFSPVK